MPEAHRPKKIEHLEIGCTQFEIVNNSEYCGKILVHRAGTATPAHSHKRKHETFLIWSGTVEMTVNGKTRIMKPGDVLSVDRGTVHAFAAVGGDAVLLEFSTSSSPKDSYFVEEGMWEKVNRRSPETTDYDWPF
jgi:quercetin dioxygenase-like cupin family protein